MFQCTDEGEAYKFLDVEIKKIKETSSKLNADSRVHRLRTKKLQEQIEQWNKVFENSNELKLQKCA